MREVGGFCHCAERFNTSEGSVAHALALTNGGCKSIQIVEYLIVAVPDHVFHPWRKNKESTSCTGIKAFALWFPKPRDRFLLKMNERQSTFNTPDFVNAPPKLRFAVR